MHTIPGLIYNKYYLIVFIPKLERLDVYLASYIFMAIFNSSYFYNRPAKVANIHQIN